MEGFSRRATAILTRSSLHRLAYLERIGLIVPSRLDSLQRPTVVYTWEQILEIRAINQLRRQISFQRIRKIIQFLDDHGFDPCLRNKHLVVRDDTINWIRSLQSPRPQVIQIADKYNRYTGQLLIPTFSLLAADTGPGTQSVSIAKVIDLEQFRQRC